MATMTKKKLIHDISQEKGMHPNEVRVIVQAFLDKITNALVSGDRIEFRDFGIFESVIRKQKVGRNPKRPEAPVIIPERRAVKFTPGKKMKQLIEELGTPKSSS